MHVYTYTRLIRISKSFLKVIEIDNAIFQDLENFVKGRLFIMAMGKLWIFVWKI